MAETATPAEPPPPRIVEYDPITGVPAEFNDYLPKDSDEYKRLKAHREGAAPPIEGALAELAVGDGAAPAAAPAAEAAAGGGGGGEAPPPEKEKKPSKKKKGDPAVVLERNTRQKKKCVTTVSGLDLFGVKLPEAAKLFGKKFACGASVGKNAEGREQIDVQGDCLEGAAELIAKTYAAQVKKSDIFFIEAKARVRYFPDD